MAATINSYIADQGEVAITLSAANVSAISAFTTAEEIVLDGAVYSMRRTNNPAKQFVTKRVTGSTTPISKAGSTTEAEQWEIMLVDDYHEGLAGEWGTDNLAAVEIFRELYAADQHPSALQCTPAGGATGDIELSLVNPKVLAVGVPEIVADANDLAVVPVLIGADYHTRATHA